MRKVTRKELMEMIENDEDYSLIDVSEITDFRFVFYEKTVKFDISKWNTKSAENMGYMFNGAVCTFPLNDWDVSNVENMKCMFDNSKYNNPLNNWDVSNVEDMSGMFCESIYNHPLNDWDVSSVKNMKRMFHKSKYNHPLNDWDVSNVNDMFFMFYGSKYNYPLRNWNVSNVQRMNSMFEESCYNHPLNNWDVSNVKEMFQLFKFSNYRHPLDNWKIQKDGWAIQEVFDEAHLVSYPQEIDFKELYHAASFFLRSEHKEDFVLNEVENHLVNRNLLELNFLETDRFVSYKLDCDSDPHLIKMKGYGNNFYFIKQKDYYFKITNNQADLILEDCLA